MKKLLKKPILNFHTCGWFHTWCSINLAQCEKQAELGWLEFLIGYKFVGLVGPSKQDKLALYFSPQNLHNFYNKKIKNYRPNKLSYVTKNKKDQINLISSFQGYISWSQQTHWPSHIGPVFGESKI